MSSRLVFLALAGALTLACNKEPAAPVAPPPPPQAPKLPSETVAAAPPAAAVPAAAPSDPAQAEAAQLFRSRCAPCHGVNGAGDGPVSAALNPKPRSFGDPVWQKEVTDAYLEKVILEGGAAVGKSPIMPASPDLKDKPAVVQALRNIVRQQGQR